MLDLVYIDDVVNAIPVHLMAGIWGTLAVGIFGDLEVMGIEHSRFQQIQIQLIGIATIGLFCFVTSYIIFNIINIRYLYNS